MYLNLIIWLDKFQINNFKLTKIIYLFNLIVLNAITVMKLKEFVKIVITDNLPTLL